MKTLLVCITGALVLGSCDWDFNRMVDQRRFDPYESTAYFDDGTIMRRPPPGTVSRSKLVAPPPVSEGMQAGQPVEEVPLAVTEELLQRGRDRYDIFCAPCHGVLGQGDTIVARNMKLRPPPSLHLPRLRTAPAGHIFGVITQGFGFMPSYAARMPIADRWAVVAYVQALQLSQYALLDDLPADTRQEARTWLN